jgi:hypothetical protein
MRAGLSLSALILFLSSFVNAGDKGDIVKRSIEQSQLTLAGSRPFHLKASVVEATNLENDEYKAEIEEYWVSPDKWTRTLKSAHFMQTLTVDGGKVSEQNTGDYYPNWLRTLVSAMFDPGAALEGVDLSQSSDNPVYGGSQLCRRFSFRAGIAPVGNNVFSSYCFQSGLIASVGKPGYHAEYKDYKKFGEKKVARKIREYIEPGTELEASIENLEELQGPEDSLFAIKQATPELQTIQITESALRSLALNPAPMQWPPVRAGKTSGVLSLFVSIDRDGRVREIFDLNSDHPDMSDAARKQVMDWTFRRAASHGTPVQVESILTFAYETRIDDPIPLLKDDEARKQSIRIVEPDWPANFAPPGTPIILKVSVDENGQPKGLTGINTDQENQAKGLLSIDKVARILGIAKEAVKKWQFRPYLLNGKATVFDVQITFHVKAR